jgi:hypothetical protein
VLQKGEDNIKADHVLKVQSLRILLHDSRVRYHSQYAEARYRRWPWLHGNMVEGGPIFDSACGIDLYLIRRAVG